jgi:uncharacterized protein YgiM (DUF1202 family)
MQAYMHVCAAILVRIGAKPIMAAGHKEFALPKGRKDDPSFDMVMFRDGVARIMGDRPAPAAVSRAGVVNVDGLNVRSNASASSTIVNVLDKGAKVSISGEIMNGATKWLRIGDGYVAAGYVDLA